MIEFWLTFYWYTLYLRRMPTFQDTCYIVTAASSCFTIPEPFSSNTASSTPWLQSPVEGAVLVDTGVGSSSSSVLAKADAMCDRSDSRMSVVKSTVTSVLLKMLLSALAGPDFVAVTMWDLIDDSTWGENKCPFFVYIHHLVIHGELYSITHLMNGWDWRTRFAILLWMEWPWKMHSDKTKQHYGLVSNLCNSLRNSENLEKPKMILHIIVKPY